MAKIGVFGSDLRSRAIGLFGYFLKDGEEHTVVPLPGGNDGEFDIIVCVEDAPGLENLAGVGESTVFVADPDNKSILSHLPRKGAGLITCGFNGKDCVTASSVTENELQVCVQRNIPTADGRILEPQEFGVRLDMYDKRPELVLAVITALLAAGADGALRSREHGL